MMLNTVAHHLHVVMQFRLQLVPLSCQLGQQLLLRRCALLLLASCTRELLSEQVHLPRKNKSIKTMKQNLAAHGRWAPTRCTSVACTSPHLLLKLLADLLLRGSGALAVHQLLLQLLHLLLRLPQLLVQ